MNILFFQYSQKKIESNRDTRYNLMVIVDEKEGIVGQPLLASDLYTDSAQNESRDEKFLFFLIGCISMLSLGLMLYTVTFFQEVNEYITPTLANQLFNIPCSVSAMILCLIKINNYKKFYLLGLIPLIVIHIIFLIVVLTVKSPGAMKILYILLASFTGKFSSLTYSLSYSFASQFGMASATGVASGGGFIGILLGIESILLNFLKDDKKAAIILYSTGITFYVVFLIYYLYKCRDPYINERMSGKLKKDTSDNAKEEQLSLNDKIETVKCMWIHWVSTFVSICTSLSLFPGYATMISDTSLGRYKYTILVFVYGIFDWVGRLVTHFVVWPSSKYSFIICFARLVFFPAEILTVKNIIKNVEPYYSIIVQVLLGFSNGYCNTVAVIYATSVRSLSDPQKGFAGLLVSLAFNIGILVAMGFAQLLANSVNK